MSTCGGLVNMLVLCRRCVRWVGSAGFPWKNNFKFEHHFEPNQRCGGGAVNVDIFFGWFMEEFFLVRTNDNINREEKIKEGNKRGIKLISTGYLLKHITSKMHGTLLLWIKNYFKQKNGMLGDFCTFVIFVAMVWCSNHIDFINPQMRRIHIIDNVDFSSFGCHSIPQSCLDKEIIQRIVGFNWFSDFRMLLRILRVTFSIQSFQWERKSGKIQWKCSNAFHLLREKLIKVLLS